MFNLAIDSNLRGCDLVSLWVRDILHGRQILARAMVVQRKRQRPVQFELTELARVAVVAWVESEHLQSEQYLFSSRLRSSDHVSTRQDARIVHQWVASAGLYPSVYGTHSLRRTKATLIYKRTKNLRAMQLLLRVEVRASVEKSGHPASAASIGEHIPPPIRASFRRSDAARETRQSIHRVRVRWKNWDPQCFAVSQAPSPSMKRASTSGLRPLAAAAHVKR